MKKVKEKHKYLFKIQAPKFALELFRRENRDGAFKIGFESIQLSIVRRPVGEILDNWEYGGIRR